MKTWLLLALAALLACACKTDGAGDAGPADDTVARAAHGAAAGAALGASGPDIAGYDAAGAVSCPPLPAGRICVATAAGKAARAACAGVNGSPAVCEDCSVICSTRPPPPAP